MALPTGPNNGKPNVPRRQSGIPTENNGQEARRPMPAQPQREQPQRPPAQRPRQQRPQSQQPQQTQQPARPVQRPTQGEQSPRRLPQTRNDNIPQREQVRRPRQQVRHEEQFEDNFDYDDTFSQIPIDEIDQDDFGFQEDADYDYIDEPQDHFVEEPQRRRPPQAKVSHEVNFDPNVLPRDQSQDVYDDEFIDKGKKELKPFGPDKKNIKVGDFDKRKNLANNRKLVQSVFLFGIICLVGFGAYKTFMPPETYTAEEIAGIAAMQMGQTGFPTQKAEGFAKSFVESYVNISGNSIMNESLNYFYGGERAKRSFDNGTAQKILLGPVTLKSDALTATSGNFTFGVLVETTSTAKQPEGVTVEPVSHWLSFNVNVLYNKDTETFTISEDSPSLVPFITPSASSDLVSKPLGKEIDSIDVKSTVIGYMTAYQASDINNHSKLDQYVVPGAEPSVLSGFGGAIDFQSDAEGSINYKVYSASEESVDELKVLVNTTWAVRGDQDVEFASLYTTQSVMTLEKQGNGQYLVSKFAPFLFITDDSAEPESE